MYRAPDNRNSTVYFLTAFLGIFFKIIHCSCILVILIENLEYMPGVIMSGFEIQVSNIFNLSTGSHLGSPKHRTPCSLS